MMHPRSLPLAMVCLTVALVSPSFQSPVPFVCPQQDLAGRALLLQSGSAGELFCRYNSVSNDFFCKYFADTEKLKQDHDNGFCPPIVKIDCTTTSGACSFVPAWVRV